MTNSSDENLLLSLAQTAWVTLLAMLRVYARVLVHKDADEVA